MDNNLCIKVNNLRKSFGPTKALTDVDFELYKGEVHSVVGANGAGKSTFIKILSGEVQKDIGDIYVFGKKVELRNPAIARELNIYTVHQELRVVPQLSVTENIFLNNFHKNEKRILIDWGDLDKRAEKYLKNWELHIDPRKPLGSYTLAVQQIIEILKNYIMDPKILILDEPTSSLDSDEVKFLFKVINRLKEAGVSVIFISHILEEVFEISDRITIFRDSKNVGTFDSKKIDEAELVRLMVGEGVKDVLTFEDKKISDKIVFRIRGLQKKGFFKDFDFKLYENEILGIVGVRGAGKSELARIITGLDKNYKGDIFLNGTKANVHSVREAIKLGIAYIPEDRKVQGLFLELPIIDNFTMTILDRLKKVGIISDNKRLDIFNKYKKLLNIVVQNPSKKVESLSGGNQQKILVGRGLVIQPKVLLADEPTRGIDVGTKKELYKILHKIAKEGTSIIYFTDEADEALGVCDRIIIIGQEKILGEYKKNELDKKELLLKMTEGGGE